MWKHRKIRGCDLYIIYNTESPHKIHRIVEGKTHTEEYLGEIAQNNGSPTTPELYNIYSRPFTENMTDKQKTELTNKVRTYSDKEIEDDYRRLVDIGCDAKTKSVYITTGNKVVDRYTFIERLNTLGRNRITFFEFWENRRHFMEKPNIQKLLNKLEKERTYETEYTRMYNVYRLYYGSVSIFKPLLAMEYYCMFQPRTILDFTMGWGGRLVGACALNIHKYIGIDSNRRLEPLYDALTGFLKPRTQTQIELRFENALDIDYSKYTYDMVFTSPPYYNIEKYHDTAIYKEKRDWDELFYRPLFHQTFANMKKGGTYCLNISVEIYERVCIGLFGEAKHKYPMKKHSRHNRKTDSQIHMNTEFVYVWTK